MEERGGLMVFFPSGDAPDDRNCFNDTPRKWKVARVLCFSHVDGRIAYSIAAQASWVSGGLSWLERITCRKASQRILRRAIDRRRIRCLLVTYPIGHCKAGIVDELVRYWCCPLRCCQPLFKASFEFNTIFVCDSPKHG